MSVVSKHSLEIDEYSFSSDDEVDPGVTRRRNRDTDLPRTPDSMGAPDSITFPLPKGDSLPDSYIPQTEKLINFLCNFVDRFEDGDVKPAPRETQKKVKVKKPIGDGPGHHAKQKKPCVDDSDLYQKVPSVTILTPPKTSSCHFECWLFPRHSCCPT